MASYSSNSLSSSSSSSISKEWSFRSTSSSKTNYLHHDNNNTTNNLKNNEPIIIHCITTLKTPNHHHITCLTVHNNLLYAAAADKINVFDLTTFSLTNNHAFSSNARHSLSVGCFIKSILFYDRDEKILTAHQDGKIRAWERHRFVAVLPTLRDKLRRCMWGENYVNVRRGKRKLWIQHYDVVSDLAWWESNGVVFLYSVSWDKSLKIWRGSDFKCLETVTTAHDDAINTVTVSVSGRVYTGSTDGKIKAWERNNTNSNSNGNIYGSGVIVVGRHVMVDMMEMRKSTAVNALALSRDGKVLVSGGCDGVIGVWEMDEVEDRMVEIGVVGGHDGAVLCLIRLDYYDECNCDNNWDLFVSGSGDQTVRIWGGRRGGVYGCLGVLEGHCRAVRSVVVARPLEGREVVDGVVWVFSGSLDGEIKVWQVRVSKLVEGY